MFQGEKEKISEQRPELSLNNNISTVMYLKYDTILTRPSEDGRPNHE